MNKPKKIKKIQKTMEKQEHFENTMVKIDKKIENDRKSIERINRRRKKK